MKQATAAFVAQLPSSKKLPLSTSDLRPISGNFCHILFRRSSSILAASSPTPSVAAVGDVLSTEDIVVGTILAFVLAFTYSYLNGQSSSTSFVSWGNQIQRNEDSFESVETTSDDERVFDAKNWKDISREENYVLYNTRIKSKLNSNQQNSNNAKVDKTENKLVLVALLALFVPIFSVEFFFALSRQFLCEIGDPSGRVEFVQKLCSPVL